MDIHQQEKSIVARLLIFYYTCSNGFSVQLDFTIGENLNIQQPVVMI